MMVQAQEEMGEGSANPTDPHHTPTIIQPLTSQQKQRPRKTKRKDTELSQTSGPTTNVADEAINESKNVSKFSDDSLLVGVNTPRSDDDSLKLKELMELCTTLQSRVLALEQTKLTQANKIDSLKRRGRISDIDADKGITLVSIHDEQMFDVDEDLGGEEVFIKNQDENVVEKEVDAAQAKAKGIVFYEPEETTTIITTTIPKSKSQDKGKAKMIEEPVKLKKNDQIQLDEEVALKLQAKLQAEFDKEQRLARENAQKEEEKANISFIKSW
nr:hypothetical protein [Tanacetum cinerariifolium]